MGRTAVEPMRAVDAAWLHMDRPTNLMVVNTIVWTDDEIGEDDLKALIEERLVQRFRRFVQRVEDPGYDAAVTGPRWLDDDSFDLDDHVLSSTLPEPGDIATLQRVAGELASRPLPQDRPLWVLHRLSGLGNGCALLLRTHHAIADGAALMQVLLSLTDSAEGDGHEDQVDVHQDRGSGRPAGAVGEAVDRLSGAAEEAKRKAQGLSGKMLKALTEPSSVTDLVGLGQRESAMLLKLGFGLNPPSNSLQGDLVPDKLLTWTKTFPLASLKQAGRDAGLTINDLLLSAITDAFRDYLEDRGDLPEEVVVIVPVNLREQGSTLPAGLGNRFGLVWVSLPTGEGDADHRASTVKRHMDRIKASSEGAFMFQMLEAMGRLPRKAANKVIDTFAGKGTAIVTNMTGPREQVLLAGQPVTGAMAWVPVTGPVGVGLSIFSYAGRISVGLAADASLMPDPERFVTLLEEALARRVGA